jgi:signal transduction histidine kinase
MNLMQTLEPTVLLISRDEALCSALRAALERSEPACHLAAVADFAAARNAVAQLSPDLIVLQDSSLHSSGIAPPGSRPMSLADVVAVLAGFAPVVVLGKEPPANLSALIASGAADFITADGVHFPEAAACVERHLHSARRLLHEPSDSSAPVSTPEFARGETFAELLRHELNNPLTGILGNAELLLAEMRRQKSAPLSAPGVKRLETIAALAVRMRETVRRLSLASESRAAPHERPSFRACLPQAGEVRNLPSIDPKPKI